VVIVVWGVGHEGGGGGGRILRISRALVLQWCGQCRWAERDD